jgi:hypothetical protein
MRMGKVLLLGGMLLLMGAGCRGCNCGGGEQETRDQAGAQAIPQSNTAVEQKVTPLPSQPEQTSPERAPTMQPVAPQTANVRQPISEPQVTAEELNDPGFKSNLPLTSRRSLIILRKLQESGNIRQTSFPPSTEPHKPHSDRPEKQN